MTKVRDKKKYNRKYYLTHKETTIKKWKKKNRKSILEKKKEYYQKHKEEIRQYSKNYDKNYYEKVLRPKFGYILRKEYLKQVTKPLSKWTCNNKNLKLWARTLLLRAVRKGRIVKPAICEKCNKSFARNNLEGHHKNYKKWWIVKWLCRKCHCRKDLTSV